MKKLTFLAAAVSFLLASCSSDEPLSNPIDSSAKGVPVKINVTSDNEFNELRSVSPEDAGVKTMLYIVYDEATGDYVKHKSIFINGQTTIEDNLSAGTYRIAIMAATDILPEINGNKNVYVKSYFSEADQNFNSASFCINDAVGNIDYFYQDFVLNVENTSIEQPAVLKRITTKLEIIPLDAANMPDDIQSVHVKLDWLGQQVFNFKDKTYLNKFERNPEGGGRMWGFLTQSYDKQQLIELTQENPISLTLFPYSSPMPYTGDEGNSFIYITAEFVKHNETIDRILKSVYQLESNKVLRLTGNLFDDALGSDTEVSIDDEWEEVVEDNFD